MKFKSISEVLGSHGVNHYFGETGKMYVPDNNHFVVYVRDKSKRWVRQSKVVLRPGIKSMLVRL